MTGRSPIHDRAQYTEDVLFIQLIFTETLLYNRSHVSNTTVNKTAFALADLGLCDLKRDKSQQTMGQGPPV